MRTIDQILEEIKDVIEKVDEEQVKKIMNVFNKETRIFVDGEGRSGFQAKGFAMRLMHIGYNPYVMGETITPALKKRRYICSNIRFRKNKKYVKQRKSCKRFRINYNWSYK